MKYNDPIKNEKGVVLISGLVIMGILTIVGATAYMTTSSELDVSRNYRVAKKAFYAAEAGTEEARGRLKTIGEKTPDPNWRATMVLHMLLSPVC